MVQVNICISYLGTDGSAVTSSNTDTTADDRSVVLQKSWGATGIVKQIALKIQRQKEYIK